MRRAVALFSLVVALVAATPAAAASLMRLEVHLPPDARTTPRLLLLTVGGPVYCMQLMRLAHNVHASLACTDYGPNRYTGAGGRAARREDWGDPRYLDEVAHVPDALRRDGVKISRLVVIGVSYSGFGNAELVATHPELRPAALVIVDSYLDLPARYSALPPTHETKKEIETVLGGTLAQRRSTYRARSPSHHLDGLARAVRAGMRLVDVWSVAADEQREFRGATCSRLANAQWLADLSGLLNRPINGYVTHMRHAHALWDRGAGLLQLAGVASTTRPLRARAVSFRPGTPPPRTSYCTGP